jgi:hypothetical protein
MKKILMVFLAMGLVALMAAPSPASLAIDFSDVYTSKNFTNNDWSLGFEFTVNSPVFVTQLGFYDDWQNGLTETHDVGIYDAAQNLLVSTTVSPSDPLTAFFPVP